MSNRPDRTDSDLSLMRRVAANDEAAVAELYDRFAPLVYRMAYRALASRAETEDAMQDIFIRLWRTAGRFDPSRASLITWVMLIARRQLVDQLRRLRRRPRTVEGVVDGAPSRFEAPDSKLRLEESLAQTRDDIQKLPAAQRAVVSRAYFGGRTLRQIGVELNTPLGTVKTSMRRALISLRSRSEPGSTAA